MNKGVVKRPYAHVYMFLNEGTKEVRTLPCVLFERVMQ